jgi:DNA (cytosine-5)-methyltransferase 1
MDWMTFIDFFGGAGFIRKGMERASHKCIGYCEIDKFAVKSYYAIYGKSEDEWYERDVRAADPNRMPDAECYCAGFPCQAFSIAGRRGGFEDMRGTLVFEVFRLARVKKPRILFLENVEGLLNHDNGRTFGTILTAMDEIGYDAQWQLLNSRHFGIPQNRERVFIVGHLRGTSRPEVFPISGTNSQTIKIIGKLDGKFRVRNDILGTDGISTCLDTMQGGGHQPKVMIIGKDGKEKKKDYASCLTGGGHSGGNHSDMDLLVQAVLTPDRAEKRQNGRRMKEPGEPMLTLTAQDKHGVMIYQTPRGNNEGGLKDIAPTLTKNSYEHNNHLVQNHRIRRLTPRECWRLQGASDEDFDKAAAVNSESQLYKQAGNGATINVIYEIARRL